MLLKESKEITLEDLKKPLSESKFKFYSQFGVYLDVNLHDILSNLKQPIYTILQERYAKLISEFKSRVFYVNPEHINHICYLPSGKEYLLLEGKKLTDIAIKSKKLGKFAKCFTSTEAELQKLVLDISSIYQDTELLKETEDIAKIYLDCYHSCWSCMAGDYKNRFMQNLRNCVDTQYLKIAYILDDNGDIIARSLIWDNRYYDNVYGSNLLEPLLINKGYKDISSVDQLDIPLNGNFDNSIELPYMDNLTYLNYNKHKSQYVLSTVDDDSELILRSEYGLSIENDTSSRCDLCDCRINEDELYYVENSRTVCLSCLEKNYILCEGYDEYILIEGNEFFEVSGSWFCEDYLINNSDFIKRLNWKGDMVGYEDISKIVNDLDYVIINLDDKEVSILRSDLKEYISNKNWYVHCNKLHVYTDNLIRYSCLSDKCIYRADTDCDTVKLALTDIDKFESVSHKKIMNWINSTVTSDFYQTLEIYLNLLGYTKKEYIQYLADKDIITNNISDHPSSYMYVKDILNPDYADKYYIHNKKYIYLSDYDRVYTDLETKELVVYQMSWVELRGNIFRFNHDINMIKYILNDLENGTFDYDRYYRAVSKYRSSRVRRAKLETIVYLISEGVLKRVHGNEIEYERDLKRILTKILCVKGA